MPDQGFSLRSPAFSNGENIPVTFTCDGRDVSPPLEWMNAPASTRSYALVVEDPDAPEGTSPTGPCSTSPDRPEDFRRLRYDAGAEAQLLAPIANTPLRIGYGINLDRLEGESPGRFSVSLAVRF